MAKGSRPAVHSAASASGARNSRKSSPSSSSSPSSLYSPSRRPIRRRILLLADFAYASGKAVASGVIRFVSVHPGIELLAQGHTSEMQTMEEGMIPVSGIDGIVSCFGSDMDFIRRILEAAPRVPAVFASVGRVVAPLKGRRSAAIFCDHAAVADAAAELMVRHGLAEGSHAWRIRRRPCGCHNDGPDNHDVASANVVVAAVSPRPALIRDPRLRASPRCRRAP